MSAKADAWMPLYVADYRKDTARLTTEQHGAYLLLIMDYWVGGPLPDDDVALAQITRLEGRQWKRHRPALERFFQIANGQWAHKRVEEEREKAERHAEARRINGLKGGRPKKLTKTESEPTNNLEVKLAGTYEQTPTRDASPSPSPLPSEVISDANASSSPDVDAKPSTDEVRQAFDAWNDLARRIDLPKAKALDEGRRRAIKARLSADHLTGWMEALAGVERSRHCRGENDRNWKADLDFVCQAKSFRRLIEGSYGAEIELDRGSAEATDPWPGPAEIRSAIVAEKGEPWARSWLDTCGWINGPVSAVTSGNAFVIETIRREVGDVLATFGAQAQGNSA